MPPRRGLADELADLINPAPQQELDPEGGWGDGAVLNASDDELEQQVAKPSSRKAQEKGLKLRSGIELDDELYRGRKSSIAALFGDGGTGGRAPWEDVSDDGEEEDDDNNDDDNDMGGEGSEEDGEGDMEELGRLEEDGDHDDDEEEEDDDGITERGHAKGPKGGKNMLGGKRKAGVNGSVGMTAEDEEEEEGEELDGLGESEEEDDDVDDGIGHFRNGRADSEEEDDNSEGGDDEDEEEDADMDRRRSHEAAGTSRPAVANGSDDWEGCGDDDEEDEEVKRLEREYQAMQQEEAQLVRVDAQQGVKEVMKGRAVSCQQQLWERGLELRILLQKALLGCHKIPQPPVRESVLRKRQDVAQRHEALRDAAEGCLAAFSSLTTQLMMRHEDMATRLQNPPSTGTKRAHPDADPLTTPPAGTPCTAWWDTLQQQWDVFGHFRDGALDRWHRRTRLAAGATSLKTSLRALDQSISSQVASMMSGPANKRAKRVHMLSSARPRLLCHPPEESAEGKAAVQSSEAREEDDDRALDTYDDGEFYQQLLKELLESGTSGGVSYAAIKSQKKRKNVDRRASKGRKIRYQVHEKLVNFATPVEMELPPFAKHLFANLFGHQTA